MRDDWKPCPYIVYDYINNLRTSFYIFLVCRNVLICLSIFCDLWYQTPLINPKIQQGYHPLNSCHWHLIYLSGAVRLGEQWCGFDESHTGVCIKGHVSRGSLQADCILVFPIVLKKQGEYLSVCNW